MTDRDGIKALLERAKELFPRLSHSWLDAVYDGEGKDWVQKFLSCGRWKSCGYRVSPATVWVPEGKEPEEWDELRARGLCWPSQEASRSYRGGGGG